MVRINSILAIGLVAVLTALHAPSAAANPDFSEVCGVETAKQEKIHAIPQQLLHAISLVESGRWDSEKKASFAWPWTVMAEGEGRFLPDKRSAVALVLKLRARGVTNIDVGCMQVNLLAHPDAFATLDAAFDPATNVAYAAKFLMDLHATSGNWPTATAWYHSQTPSEGTPYKNKVVATWNAERRKQDTRLQFAAAENEMPVGLIPLPAVAEEMATDLNEPATESHQAAHPSLTAQREEARRAAETYRQARLEEYRQKKLHAGVGKS